MSLSLTCYWIYILNRTLSKFLIDQPIIDNYKKYK